MKIIFYIAIALLTLSTITRQIQSERTDSAFDIQKFSELPVQVGGRIKPLDSVARNTLMILSGRQYTITPEGTKISSIQWFIDLCMQPELADTYRIFKIEFPDELGLEGLEAKSKRYYSYNDLQPYFEEIQTLYQNLEPEAKKRNAYERQIAEIHNGLLLYNASLQSLHPTGNAERLNRLIDEYQSYESIINQGLDAIKKQQNGEAFDKTLLDRFIAYGDNYLNLSKTARLRIIPPETADQTADQDAALNDLSDWKNVGLELLDVMKGERLSPVLKHYAQLTMAYRSDNAEAFNQGVDAIHKSFKKDFPKAESRVQFERWFNGFKPFALSIQLYVFAFFLLAISWLKWGITLNRTAFWLLTLAFLIHTFGLIARMYIQGRPPVTNLYSSAVFVGWGAVFLGLFIEKIYKNGIGGAMASLIGFATLIIAHHLAMTGDTLEMMRAVLDSNFWLATHVIIITFGYSAMFLAGALAIAFILMALLSKKFDKDKARSLSNMVYGITCFAALFSLVGTILGGIWADQSWGRFWGWDPKENGALMIVIMGAIVLHARWGGICQERGIMLLAILGNIVTAWSWFGTNLLGVGLHSYGFTDSGFFWMLLFALSQLFVIVLGLLPWRYWASPFALSKAEKIKRSEHPKEY